jgi:hypothetical protein
MAPAPHLHGQRDDLILALLGLALLITFVADAIGWFRVGLFFR